MEVVLIFVPLLIISFFQSSSSSILPKSPYLGIHPEDEKYYFESQLIQCKDGSKSFTRDRLNDGFCDCIDGTDEPDGFITWKLTDVFPQRCLIYQFLGFFYLLSSSPLSYAVCKPRYSSLSEEQILLQKCRKYTTNIVLVSDK
ncbi:hypothetical protein C5167_043161 [Papaver somniferum]|uniref:Glucosidase II beta subunit N-terminal domain-containing protein n=1 Tax=Papaver somniferum TaxID=3469 RepID=A0A4Y7L4X9_PAPSO|nr:hypothetical protein C5167_043161 [Papaver somniferum]